MFFSGFPCAVPGSSEDNLRRGKGRVILLPLRASGRGQRLERFLFRHHFGLQFLSSASKSILNLVWISRNALIARLATIVLAGLERKREGEDCLHWCRTCHVTWKQGGLGEWGVGRGDPVALAVGNLRGGII